MHPIIIKVYMCFYLIYCYVEAFIKLFILRTSKSVSGKIVLVTGAGHGIGRELALQLSQRGAKLILWDINKKNNESVASEIEERGGFVKAYTVDVTDTENIKTVARQVRRDVGHVEILINNAGILHGGSIFKLREEDIKRLYEINVLAHFWTAREFLPSMIERGEGHIVAIASAAAHAASAYLTDYASSKAAVACYMEGLRDEMNREEGHKGLEFTTVYPYFVNTGMAQSIRSKTGPAMPIDWVASVIVDGVCKNKHHVYVPPSQELVFRIRGLIPDKCIYEFARKMDVGINPQYK